MAQPTEPPPVKLICGMIAADASLFESADEALSRAFGPIDHASGIMPFDMTEYYHEETGRPLLRRFVSFEQPVNPDILVLAKHATNAIEADFASRRAEGAPPRPINLDPGYVTQAKLVLASMKNFSHRIYLARGVYAEVTMIYHKDGWAPLAWTFPDFASGRYDGFLNRARALLRERKEHVL